MLKRIPGKRGDSEIPSVDRLVYISSCLIGHQVEVQVLDGSIFSGILHATNMVQDLGLLKDNLFISILLLMSGS